MKIAYALALVILTTGCASGNLLAGLGGAAGSLSRERIGPSGGRSGWWVLTFRGERRAGPFVDYNDCDRVARIMYDADPLVSPYCRYTSE